MKCMLGPSLHVLLCEQRIGEQRVEFRVGELDEGTVAGLVIFDFDARGGPDPVDLRDAAIADGLEGMAGAIPILDAPRELRATVDAPTSASVAQLIGNPLARRDPRHERASFAIDLRLADTLEPADVL